jgi:hemoglobin
LFVAEVLTMSTPYQLLGGDEGVKRLAYAFYQAMDQLPEAEVIRRMHAESLSDVSERLYQYLSGWLGGPGLYQEKFGTVCLTKPHKPFAIGEAERDQWLLCMDKALDDIGASDEVKTMMKQPVYRLADFIRNK